MQHCLTHFDKKIRIERLSGTADAHGHVDNTTESNWTQHATGWAKVISKGGREFWKVQQVNADVSHVWTVQYSKAVAAATPAMRLIHDGLTYEIMSVVNVDLNNNYVEIQTRRAV